LNDWPDQVYRILRDANITHAAYVPDAGHSTLIRLFNEDKDVVANVLTTEEEGVAIAAGAWLGGVRSVVLMQSSGVGNCINMLATVNECRTPLLMLITMRGEWGEFNPWQVPMGQATQGALEAIGVRVFRADAPEDLIATVRAAAVEAFDGDQQVAILIGQRLLGEKKW
jgi:sulfopyruvate decarboxylase alpha subunit